MTQKMETVIAMAAVAKKAAVANTTVKKTLPVA